MTVLDLSTSDVRDHRLVETDREYATDGEVSIRAPLGSALLGRHVGDVVSVEDLRREIVEIDG